MQIIKFPDAPEWTQKVRLDGKSFKLRARWNTSSLAWSLDLLTSGSDAIVTGIRILRGQAMLRQFQDARLPEGDLFAYDTGARSGEYLDFTEGRAKLSYITASEVEELSGA